MVLVKHRALLYIMLFSLFLLAADFTYASPLKQSALFHGLRSLQSYTKRPRLNAVSTDGDSHLSPTLKNFSTKYENWMGDLIGDDLNKSRFANRSIMDIVIPGTHDSGAYNLSIEPAITNTHNGEFQSLLDLMKQLGLTVGNAIRPWGEAQRLSIDEQLRHGVRFFDMRPGWHNDSQTWRVFHGVWGKPIRELFEEVEHFLDTHPLEVVFMQCFYMFKSNPTEEQLMALATMIEEVFGDYLLPKERGLRTPLKDMILTGHRLQVFFYDDDGIEVARAHPLLYEGHDSLNRRTAGGQSHDPEEVTDRAKRLVFEYMLTDRSNEQKIAGINFVATPQLKTVFESILPDKPKSLFELAELMNANLPEFRDFLIKNRYDFGSILDVDFVEESLLVEMCVEWNERLISSSSSDS